MMLIGIGIRIQHYCSSVHDQSFSDQQKYNLHKIHKQTQNITKTPGFNPSAQLKVLT